MRPSTLESMQTVRPYDDFEKSARALDTKRLGKQRVETIQVVRALTWEGYGWRNHPAWLGDEDFHRSHQSALVRRPPTTTDRCFRTFRTTCPTSGRRGAESAAQDARRGP
ncbi:MAG: pyrimidine dimer DNA glycosylase/endonuclease V [Marmoricola sp.]